MVNFDSAIQLLQAKRRELLEQLSAIDRAIDALAPSNSTIQPDRVAPVGQTAEQTAPPVVMVPPKRALTEAHKAALREGRRKAREAKLRQSQGLEPGTPAMSVQADPLPRLVKRSHLREFTLAPVDDQQDVRVS